MQKGKEINGANPDGTVNNDTIYIPESWNDNIGNMFEVVERSGYSLIDDNLEQLWRRIIFNIAIRFEHIGQRGI